MIGVDTHRDTHAVEIASPTGVVIATVQIDNDSGSFAALLGWIVQHAPGPRVLVAVEGTRSYGIGLTRALTAAGLPVIEAAQPSRSQRRGKGKSDPIDAHHAVLTALRTDPDRLPTPRADGDREALRILLNARQDLSTTHTARTNRLKALLLSGEDRDRELARGKLTAATLKTLTSRRLSAASNREHTVRHGEIQRLAHSLRESHAQLRANLKQLQQIVDELAPALTELFGVGPVSAAQVIVSYSHPGRCRNEAAFAALGGVNPIPASSGRTQRHRLNRGGDRALNKALHTIALTRIRSCERTQAYVTKRTAQSKSPREIRRCLKRYIARELYRTLTAAMTPAAAA